MLKAVRQEGKQILSVRLIVLGLIMGMLHAFSDVGFRDGAQHAWYLFRLGVSSGAGFFTFYMLPTLCRSHTFITEWQSHASDFYRVRSGLSSYTAAKMAGAFMGGFFSVFLGLSLYAISLLIQYPPFLDCFSMDSYETLMMNGYVFSGYALFIVDMSLSGGITGAFGMLCSMFFMSPYTAVLSPVILYIGISLIRYLIRLPDWTDPMKWMTVYTASSGPFDAIIWKLLITVVIVGAMLFIALKRVRRLADV